MKKEIAKNKKGFATATTVITGLISVGFLLIFSLLFFNYMTDDDVTGSGTTADLAGDYLTANFSSGVRNVNSNIPTVFSIAVFVLIISVLLIAYVFARRNGLLGGGQLG